MDSVEELDPIEHALWLRNPTPELPRSVLREKKDAGGQFAILRDISGSMTGMQSRWASSLVLDLMDLAKEKRMKVGYCEFNDKAHMKYVDGRFFVRVQGDQQEKLVALANHVGCNGFTNYEATKSQP